MKIPKLKKWQIIEIDWIDSGSVDGWIKDNLEYALSDLEYKSAGYFLKETDYSICIVQSKKEPVKAENTQINSLMEIPKVAITKIKLK